MGFSKGVLLLLVFLGATFAEKDVKVSNVARLVEGCIIDCSAGQYHQHPSDCHKFIQCTPYGPQEMPCPETTVWDQNITVCNHDDSVACETGHYLTPEGKSCPEVPVTPAAPTEEPTEAPIPECDFKCPIKEGFVPHPRDCNRFFYCLHFHPIPVKCPFGLHFSPKAEKCTIPLKAKCQATPDAKC